MRLKRHAPGSAGTKLLLLLLLGGAAAGYWYWTTTPQYALHALKAAARDHDRARFYQYVDVDSIVSHGLSDLADANVDTGSAIGNAIAKPLLSGLAGLVASPVASMTKDRIDQFILSTAPPSTGDVLGRFMFDARETATAKSVQTDGALATMVVTVSDPKDGRSTDFECKLQQVDGHFQFVQITNLHQLGAELLHRL